MRVCVCVQEVVVSYNEDVEVGRCVSKMVNLQCTWAWEVSTGTEDEGRRLVDYRFSEGDTKLSERFGSYEVWGGEGRLERESVIGRNG